MNKIFTLWISILVLFSGCAKQTYYFSKASTESNSDQKKIADKNSQVSMQANQSEIGPTRADTLNKDVTAGLAQISKQSIPDEAKAIAHYLTAANKTEIKSVTATKEGESRNKLFKKKLIKQVLADEKPANKKGKAGFILSLVGLGITLAGLLFSPLFIIGFLASVAGIIFSALGLSEIKENPGQYSNRSKAMAGLVISITTVALTLLFTFLTVLFLLILLSAWQ